jgi:hypothetical protein
MASQTQPVTATKRCEPLHQSQIAATAAAQDASGWRRQNGW